MDGVDCSLFAAILDDIEETLDAHEDLQELSRTPTVADGVPRYDYSIRRECGA
jgi:hypothetical protein